MDYYDNPKYKHLREVAEQAAADMMRHPTARDMDIFSRAFVVGYMRAVNGARLLFPLLAAAGFIVGLLVP